MKKVFTQCAICGGLFKEAHREDDGDMTDVTVQFSRDTAPQIFGAFTCRQCEDVLADAIKGVIGKKTLDLLDGKKVPCCSNCIFDRDVAVVEKIVVGGEAPL